MPSVRFRLIAVTGVTAISFTAIIVRQADTAPVTVAFYRSLYSVPALLVLWWLVRKRDLRSPRSRALAFGSGVLLAIDLTFFHIAIDRIGAGLAMVLVNVQVVFVALIAWIIHRERPSQNAFKLIPLVFVGVVLLSGLGRDDAYGKDPWLGVVTGLLGGLFYALFLLTLRASNRGHLAPTMGPILDSTVGVGVGAFLIGVLTPADLPLSVSAETHWWLLLLAILAQVVGWPLINMALPRLAALETSTLILAQPMLAILWALLIFNEDLSLVQWSGVAIMLGGLLILSTRGAVEPSDLDAVVEPGPSGDD
jgi:drug/metabolite transporter (DMT)-like permease